MLKKEGNNLIKVIENFKPEDWWLVNYKGVSGNKEFRQGFWTLNQKIDRSYKGKDPDIAVESLAVESLAVESPEELAFLKNLKIDIVWI